MASLSNYNVDDLERLAIEQLHTYVVSGRRSPRAQDAADRAADALWELRTRHTLADGRVDVNGLGAAYRAIASRIYSIVTRSNPGRDFETTHQQISTAMQRRMKSRRDAWTREQEA